MNVRDALRALVEGVHQGAFAPKASRAIRRHPYREPEPMGFVAPKSGARKRRWLKGRDRNRRRVIRSSKRGRLAARSSGS